MSDLLDLQLDTAHDAILCEVAKRLNITRYDAARIAIVVLGSLVADSRHARRVAARADDPTAIALRLSPPRILPPRRIRLGDLPGSTLR